MASTPGFVAWSEGLPLFSPPPPCSRRHRSHDQNSTVQAISVGRSGFCGLLAAKYPVLYRSRPRIPLARQSRSSVVEHLLDMEVVGGSIPLATTISLTDRTVRRQRFWPHAEESAQRSLHSAVTGRFLTAHHGAYAGAEFPGGTHLYRGVCRSRRRGAGRPR